MPQAKMKKPSIPQKYLTLAIVLPVLGDFIEDLRDSNIFRQDLKRRANMFLDIIRTADNKFYDRSKFKDLTDEQYQQKIREMGDKQHEIAMLFRSWVVENISDPMEK
jgi:hypothetical protein